MIWIMGGDAVAAAVGKLGAGNWLSRQFEHADWEGFHFYDLIFPMFVFMVGVAITFSLGRIVSEGGAACAVRRIVRRSAILFVIGVLFYGGLDGPLSHVRLLGVLQRIALCYFFAGLLFVYLRPRGLVAVLAAILAGYWLLMRFWPVPGWGAGDFAEGHNLANWIDSRWLPWRKWDGDHDPEGLLSTLPAVATCLLGVLSGLVLRGARRPSQKAVLLASAGALLAGLGYLWGLEFPIIKKVWTSSYVLVAGGWSMLFLSLFYYVIDVRGAARWSIPFVWVGTNALAIYVTAEVADFRKVASRFTGGPVHARLEALAGGLGDLVTGLAAVGVCLALGRFLYTRRVFIRL
jgi:predicted acyltransferase